MFCLNLDVLIYSKTALQSIAVLVATFSKILAKPSNLIDEILLNKFWAVIQFVWDVDVLSEDFQFEWPSIWIPVSSDICHVVNWCLRYLLLMFAIKVNWRERKVIQSKGAFQELPSTHSFWRRYFVVYLCIKTYVVQFACTLFSFLSFKFQ